MTPSEATRTTGPSYSREFDHLWQSMAYDLGQLYTLADTNQRRVLAQMTAAMRENFFLQQRLSELETDLDTLEQQVADGINRLVKVYTDAEGVYYSLTGHPGIALGNRAQVDVQYRQVTLPVIRQSHRLKIMDSDNIALVPNTTVVTLQEGFDPDHLTTQIPAIANLLKTSIAGDIFPFRRGITHLDGPLYAHVEVKVPRQLLSSVRANSFNIRPYPTGTLTIDQFQLQDLNGNWNTPDHFVQIDRLHSTRFLFGSQDVAALRFRLQQPYGLSEGDDPLFEYGLYGVELMQIDFAPVAGKWLQKFTAPSGQSFDKILTPRPVWAAGAPGTTADISYKLWYEYTNNAVDVVAPAQFGVSLPAAADVVYIECALRSAGGVSPALRALEVPYIPS